MRHRSILIAVLLLSTLALPAFAMRPTPRVEALLGDAISPADLRAHLLAYADSIGAATPAASFAAGDAWYYAGMSFDRGGNGDSAVACYDSAIALRNAGDERRALAFALTRRQGPGDLARARAILTRMINESGGGGEGVVGSLAWATYLAGQPDSAALLFGPNELTLANDLEWRYRMAHVSLDLGDRKKAALLLYRLAVLSRKQDTEVMGMLEKALGDAVPPERVASEVERGMRAHDIGEAKVIQSIGGQRVSFNGQDGFPLGGVLVARPTTRRQHAAVILVAPGDTLVSYDSLAVGLSRAGFASMMLDVRGSGFSVGEDCPLPTTWRGREEFLHSQVATDITTAFRVLTASARVDTTKYLVLASGSTASIAAEAAARDPRIVLLAFVSPMPSPVDRGPMRAWVASRKLPLFISSAPEDFLQRGLVERLYAASDRPVSRTIDARVPGTGVATLRSSHDTLVRFLSWTRECWPAPVRAAPRPTSPRAR